MTTEQLINTIATAANCTPADIMGKSKLMHISNARAVLQHALRKHKWKHTRIARLFKMDHSSVIYNVRKVEKAIEIARIHQSTIEAK